MAEVAITLKLTASEFQTLRDELKDHADYLHSLTRGTSADAKRALMKREAATKFILEKLG